MVAIEVVKSELVSPSEETPKHGLWLPNLDIMHVAKSPTPLIYVYRSNNEPDFFDVEKLKVGLSKALVPFYPLAGRLGKDQNGRLEINCGGQGVMLVIARSSSSIEEFGEFLPSPEMCRMLTPSIPLEDPNILFMTQVTFFPGGEVILGTSWSHVAGDGKSAMTFMMTWCRMTRGITNPDVHPLHDRTLLRARSPPQVLFDHIGNELACAATTRSPSATSILPLTRSQLALLTMNSKISAFCAVSAHVWKCVCIARGLPHDQLVRLNFPVNARGRMSPPLPDDYFGNVVCRMVAVATVHDVISNPIEVVAKKIRDEIGKVNDEYVRSFIDHLEVSAMAKVLTLTDWNTTEGSAMLPANGLTGTKNNFSLTPTTADLGVVSWYGMPLYDTDFGWGKPDIVRRATIDNGWYAYTMDGPNGDEVLVPVILEKESMERFKKVFYEGLDMNGASKVD